ncbi:MAG: MFS transporter [Candidatus Woesearchaeota archaeon]
MDHKKEYIIIFILLVTEVFGFSLILPFLPFYAQELGATPFMVGMILAIFSICQFISAPIMGKLSDHYGRKPLLVFAQFSTFLGFLILGLAKSLPMIFLSRIVDGMLGANFTIAMAYLSDISTKENRSKAFGISGAAFGFGFLFGPAIGGFLAQWGYSVPSFMAAGVSLISIFITMVLLPETIKKKRKLTLSMKVFGFGDFAKYFREKSVAPKLWEFSAYSLAHVLLVSSLAMYAERQLGLGSSNVGILYTYVGFLSIVLRGIMLPKLIDRFGEKRLQFAGITSILIAMVGVLFVSEYWHLFLFITFFSFGTGVARPVMTGAISRSVSDKEQGAVLGVTNSIGSLAQIAAPLIGGFMINYFFPGSFALVAAAVMILALWLMRKSESKQGV